MLFKFHKRRIPPYCWFEDLMYLHICVPSAMANEVPPTLLSYFRLFGQWSYEVLDTIIFQMQWVIRMQHSLINTEHFWTTQLIDASPWPNNVKMYFLCCTISLYLVTIFWLCKPPHLQKNDRISCDPYGLGDWRGKATAGILWRFSVRHFARKHRCHDMLIVLFMCLNNIKDK